MCFWVVCTVHADDAAAQRWNPQPATSCTARSITTLCACQGSDWPGLRVLYGPGETAISRSQCGPSWLRLVRICRPLSGTPPDTELVPLWLGERHPPGSVLPTP